MEQIYRTTKEGMLVKGIGLPAFIFNGDYYCALIKIYEDGIIDCWDLVDFDGFVGKVKDGWVVTNLPKESEVSISRNNSFYGTSSSIVTYIKEDDFVLEVRDVLDKLQGRPTSSGKCLNAFVEYLSDPTNLKKNNLKYAYELVPSHMRRYILGDMDLKDKPIKFIIENETVHESMISDWLKYYLPRYNSGISKSATEPQ